MPAVPLLMISADAPNAAGIVFDEVFAKPLRPRVLKAYLERARWPLPWWTDPTPRRRCSTDVGSGR